MGALTRLNVTLLPSLVPEGCSPKTIAGCQIASVAERATKIEPETGASDPPISTVDVAVSSPDALAPVVLLLPDEYSNCTFPPAGGVKLNVTELVAGVYR